MAVNDINPRSAYDDKRILGRGQENFSGGMVSDLEPVNIPLDSVSYLNNARGHIDEIRGRTGSRLALDINIPEYPSKGTSFNAIYDKTTATISTTYKAFSDHVVGYYLKNPETNDIFLITEYVDEYTILVSASLDIESFTLKSLFMYGRLNASYSDIENSIHYYLFGKELYYLDLADIVYGGFKKIYFDPGSTPDNVECFFHNINNNICLINPNGFYAIKDCGNTKYAYKLNNATPEWKINANIDETSPYHYNYTYSYSLLDGPFLNDRNEEANNVIIETAPYFRSQKDYSSVTEISDRGTYIPDGQDRDFNVVYSDTEPYGTIVQSINIGVNYEDNYSYWQKLSADGNDVSVIVNYNFYSQEVHFDFENVETMYDVFNVFRMALKSANSNIEVSFAETSPSMKIYSTNVGDIVELSAGSSGYDLITNSILILDNSPNRYISGIVASGLRYPSNYKGYTHYTLYRSKRINQVYYDYNQFGATGSNPEAFAWVADVPVCKIFIGSLTSNKYTFDDRFSYNDMYTEIYRVDSGNVVKVGVALSYDPDTDQYQNSMPAKPDFSNEKCFIGSKSLLILSQSGNTVYVHSVYGRDPISEDDVGKIIFWETGLYSIIKRFVANDTIEVADSTERSFTYALIDPTYRAWNDTVNDDRQNGFLNVLPLKKRFNQPLETDKVSTYLGGVLACRGNDTSDINYVDTTFIYNAGYHNRAFQINSIIEGDIKSMYNVGAFIVICTSNRTYTVNTAQSDFITNENFGESYVLIQDPVLVSASIGMTNHLAFDKATPYETLVVTSEPAIRMFNGTAYGNNLSEGTIQKNHIQKLDKSILPMYDPVGGIYLWGKRGRADV